MFCFCQGVGWGLMARTVCERLRAIIPAVSRIRNEWSQVRKNGPSSLFRKTLQWWTPSFISSFPHLGLFIIFHHTVVIVRKILSKVSIEQVLIAHSERFISYHWQCIFGERFSTLFLPCRSVFLPVPHSNQHVSFGDLEVPLHGKPEAASLCRVNLMRTKQHAIVIIWPYLRHWWIPLTQM